MGCTVVVQRDGQQAPPTCNEHDIAGGHTAPRARGACLQRTPETQSSEIKPAPGLLPPTLSPGDRSYCRSLAPLAWERRVAVVAAELAILVKVVAVGHRTPLARPGRPLIAGLVGEPLSVGEGRPGRDHQTSKRHDDHRATPHPAQPRFVPGSCLDLRVRSRSRAMTISSFVPHCGSESIPLPSSGVP